MNYYFITGTSRGIGKATAELILQGKDNFVYGLSRTRQIIQNNYEHIKIDLSNPEAVKEFEFPDFENPDSIILINNSASITEITSFGKANTDDIIEGYNVNIVSPGILINCFLKKYQLYKCKRMILNISSGAAKVAIESWGVYCSSKAALSMLSEVIDLEQKLKFSVNPVKVFSVSPGVVDTAAQEKIRNTSEENFSLVGKFIEYKEKNQLATPEEVAGKLIQLINSPDKFEKAEINVKDI